MAKNNKTIFQRLGGVLKGHSGSSSVVDNFMSNSFEPNKILFQTSDKEEYEKKIKNNVSGQVFIHAMDKSRL